MSISNVNNTSRIFQQQVDQPKDVKTDDNKTYITSIYDAVAPTDEIPED